MLFENIRFCILGSVGTYNNYLHTYLSNGCLTMVNVKMSFFCKKSARNTLLLKVELCLSLMCAFSALCMALLWLERKRIRFIDGFC